jgi:FRG domain protein
VNFKKGVDVTSESVWKKNGWYFEATSRDEVMVAIARLGVHSKFSRFAWRGLSNCNYTLTSSLHRSLEARGVNNITEDRLRDEENNILKEARKWGLGLKGGSMVDDLQLLADLQHFGVPTRLIDVTSNPMTALWFACRASRSKGVGGSKRNGKSGVLVALNLSSLYDKEGKAGEEKEEGAVFTTVGDPGETKGDLNHQLQRGLNLNSPFVVSSAIPNSRLKAQEGYFVACKHPTVSTEPLTSLNIDSSIKPNFDIREMLTEKKRRGQPAKIPYLAILIPSNFKEDLNTFLKHTFNRSDRVLFPDYQGFADHYKGIL